MVETTENPRCLKSGVLIRRRKDGRRANAITHGLRSALGVLPPGCRSIVRRRNRACRELEAAIRSAHRRPPTFTEQHVIDEYRSWLTYRLLLERWADLAAHEMTGPEIHSLERKVAHASSRLRVIVEALGLDKGRQSVLRDTGEPLTPEQQAAIRAARERNQQTIAELEARNRKSEWLSRVLASGEPIRSTDGTHQGFPFAHEGQPHGEGALSESASNTPVGLPRDQASLDVERQAGGPEIEPSADTLDSARLDAGDDL